jgi:hypothetical protein
MVINQPGCFYIHILFSPADVCKETKGKDSSGFNESNPDNYYTSHNTKHEYPLSINYVVVINIYKYRDSPLLSIDKS